MKTALIVSLVMGLLQSSQTATPNPSGTIWVVGQIKSPGGIVVEGHKSVVEVIFQSGGFGSEAAEAHVFYRTTADTGDGPIHSRLPDLKIPRDEVENGKAYAVKVKPGDTIFVSRAPPFFVTGCVRAPAAYALTTRLSVWQAVAAIAGGLTERAAESDIYVVRVYGDKTQKIKVGKNNLHSFVVRPGDTIVVPPRKF